MKVDIDLAADALSVEWGRRSRAGSQVFSRPGKRGLRLYFSDDGDVVGFEVLGWSARTADPTDVSVSIHAAHSAETLSPDDQLVRALGAASVETNSANRPLQNGQPMLTLAEAALLIGKERSWLSREMSSGKLLALKIGRTWWTTRSWVDAYREERAAAPGGKLLAGQG